ncbi:MAG: YtxH domain-containing protein [Acidobacteria bacterium]|nr:YtxH domain-containing protein [Acidobacteriota bacterium]MBI3263023.1 YtxH domain-containing protein [Acidobacteriota bacterium]
MSKDNGGSAVLTAFILGAFTGAAVALLFAPAAGKETRELLGEKAREGRDRATELADQAREVFQRQKQNVEQAIERGREAFRDARQKEQA